MKRISVYFFDGKSLSFTLEMEALEMLICWINAETNFKPFKIISNKLEYYIFKNSIQYIIM